MLIGVEFVPAVKLIYFPNEKQARKWLKKHKACRVMVVPDDCKPTKVDLDQIWRHNQKLSREECQLEWYIDHKVEDFA